MSKDKSKNAHKQRVQEKMDKAVRAAEIYNGIYEQKEMARRRRHRHQTAASKAEQRANQLQTVKEHLIQSVAMPWVYAVVIFVVASVLFSPFLGMVINFHKENYSKSKPDFSVSGEVTETFTGSDVRDGYVTLSEISRPETNENYAVINCKLAGLDNTKIYFGKSLTGLSRGVTQLEDSSLPGEGGVVTIYGYNSTFFGGLKQLTKDDEIVITTNYGVYTYKVTECLEAPVEEKSVILKSSGNKEKLVLFTELSSGVIEEPSDNMYYVCAEKMSGPLLMQ